MVNPYNKSILHISQLQVQRTSFSELERHHFVNNVQSLSKKYKSNFNEHIKFTDRYVIANPSQERLAYQADSTTRTTRRFIREVEKRNIFKFIRNHYKTNIIIPNPIIFDKKVRIMLQKEFTAFRNLPVVKSLINSENVLLTNTKSLNTNNKEYNTSKLTDSKSENKGLIEISKVIDLDNYQTTVLSEFDSSILLHSLGVLQKYPNVKEKFRFIVKVCKNKLEGTQPVRYNNDDYKVGGGFKKPVQERINTNHSPQIATASKIDSRDELKINIQKLTKEILDTSDPFVKSFKTSALKSLLKRLDDYEIYNPQEIKKDSPKVKFDVNFNEIYVDDDSQFEEILE